MLSSKAHLVSRWLVILVPVILIPVVLTGAPDTVAMVTTGCLLAVAVVGLDFMTGYAGQPNMGQGAFYAIGAYGVTTLTTLGLAFGPALLLTLVLSLAVAVVLGVGALRLAHIGLALVTFSFAFVIYVVLGGKLLQEFTGASSGIAVPGATLAGIDLSDPTALALTSIGVLTVVVVIVQAVLVSHFGRVMMTLKRSDLLAAALGIKVFRAKLVVLLVSSVLAALAGALSAQVVGFLSPDSYTALFSIALVAIAAVGGLGTIVGGVLAAFIYVAIGQVGAHQPSSGLWWPVLFLLMLIVSPAGIVGLLLGMVERLGLRRRRPVEPESADGPEGDGAEDTGLRPVDGPLLALDGVTVRYGGVTAIRDVSFRAEPGSVHALVGPNGAGKTSLLNVLTGFTRASEGTVFLDDRDLAGLSVDNRARAGIGRSFQHAMLVEDLTVRQNVLTAMENSGVDRRAARDLVEARLRGARIPKRLWHRKASELSGGEQKQVDMARAIAMSPRLLLLDEPTSGVARDAVDTVRDSIARAKDSGMTVLLIDHNVPFVEEVADRVTVLDFGVVIADGPPAETLRLPQVVAAFVGEESDAVQEAEHA